VSTYRVAVQRYQTVGVAMNVSGYYLDVDAESAEDAEAIVQAGIDAAEWPEDFQFQLQARRLNR